MNQHDTHSKDFTQRKYYFVVFLLLAIIAFFLFTEHQTHLFDFISRYGLGAIFLVLCLFMHGGHGKHNS